jgi:hypothetical protein
MGENDQGLIPIGGNLEVEKTFPIHGAKVRLVL